MSPRYMFNVENKLLPPLVDRVSNADGDVGIDNIEDEDELYEINAMLDDAMYNECEEGDEECEDEEEEDDEEDEDEEEEDEDEWVDDGDEQSEYEDEDADEEDPIEIEKRLYKFHASDENFKESDLEERKKRRFLIGQHSFYDLADPHLEDALDPLDLAAEEEGLETEEKKRRGLKAEKDFYKDMCKELGVTPDRKVLASLRELSMDLTGYGMNSKEIVALCKLLERNTHVEFLCLSGNAAGTEGGLALAELITNNETITTYELAGTE
ncbi:unnamed protein product [Orchesella dallaii]|uniref:Ran GTPase-activating protein n=1 Tax=Orchesella dallaii TaxID=48710 RepID=A0ABP1Q9A0_9HEXA